jgi:hypothetical protein
MKYRPIQTTPSFNPLKIPTRLTQIHVGAVTGQRPLVVGRQRGELGPRSTQERLTEAQGSVVNRHMASYPTGGRGGNLC